MRPSQRFRLGASILLAIAASSCSRERSADEYRTATLAPTMVSANQRAYQGEPVARVDGSVEFEDGATEPVTLTLYYGGTAAAGPPTTCAFTIEDTRPYLSVRYISRPCDGGELADFPLGAETALTIRGHVTNASAKAGPEFAVDEIHTRVQLLLAPGHGDN
jgi:hypothetical protein